MLDETKPHYSGGTAAGFKGNSLAARQNKRTGGMGFKVMAYSVTKPEGGAE